MPHFVVVRERAGAWDWSVPMRRQRAWNEHAAFMDALAERGAILAGGPLGSEDEAARVLHVFAANSIADVEAQLADDPWTPMGLLVTVSIEPWTVLLGGFAGAKGSGASSAK
ncbi:MAG TPA: YciI family protein [Candidatus Baltobacteraceae bacterium]|nr:YciI family protein [Candidatus Baltobacteraceae bacterium]